MDTVTSTTLLEGLKDTANNQSWESFVQRYRPVVFAFARKSGLSDADAEDVSQDTMLDFTRQYLKGRYNRDKGRLRGWLFGIANLNALNLRRRRAREAAVSERADAGGLMANLESPEDLQDVWEQEWQRSVFRACLEEVGKELSPTTMSAFELYVLKQWPVKKVADELGLSSNAVHIAKHRTMKRIREIKAKMEEIW